MEGEWNEGPPARAEGPEETAYCGGRKQEETAYRQAEPEGSSYRQAEPEGSAYRQAEPEGRAYRQAEPEGSACRQAEPEGSACRQAEPDGSAYRQAEPEGSAYRQAEPEGRAYRQAEPEESAYRQAEPEESAYRQAEPEGSAYRQAEPVGSAYRQAEPEGSVYHQADLEGGAYRQAKPEERTFCQAEPEGSAYRQAEPEGSAYQQAEPDESLYHQDEADETAYYDAEMDETVYYDAEADETAYYDAECDGAPGPVEECEERGEGSGGSPESDAPETDSGGEPVAALAPSDPTQAPGGSAAQGPAPSPRPRSFMAQMTSLLLRRRGRRGKASVERYKEARKLKRRAADRAKRSELNKIGWELSKAADETEPEAGWSERQKEKIRAWRAEREAQPDWAQQQAVLIRDWRQMLTDYALRQYKRAMSKAGLLRPPRPPTQAEQLAALAAYRARKKAEAFLNPEKPRGPGWGQAAIQEQPPQGIKPRLPLPALNRGFVPPFPPMLVLPQATVQPQVAWQPHPLTAMCGLLPTPKDAQPKAAAVQDLGPVLPAPMAPQATWNKAPSGLKHDFQNASNLQPTIRRDLPPSAEPPPPIYPMHMRPHASWQQAPMNVNRGMPPNPWR